jgi:sulfatase maturation enzyme AslB (radical SAM superfamily)
MSDKDTDNYYTENHYHTRKPVYIKEEDLRKDQLDRLIKSDVFCMVPWTHMHAFPDGRAYPCCLGNNQFPIGDFKKDTMKSVWNQTPYKNMRKNMLEEKPCKECTRCYEQEKSGFVSMRNSANKHFGQHISLVDNTKADGTYEDFKLRYYDIRFSNLCNFSCRTCGGWFSSSWYQEEVNLYGKRDYPQILFAGRDENDMWEQMQEHIPYLEQIYFAGGEPLIMEEHYRILKELVKREMFNVRLQYNTNFSRLNLKDEDVLDYWKLFNNVSIGASLDAMGPRAEYIRKGTKWDQIERNRERMIDKCPNVDFYVSATVSLYNILHITDFHRNWVDRGLIKPADWNINILQDPQRDRIDVLPTIYKDQVRAKIEEHLKWLDPLDPLQRASSGYRGILNFINDDRSFLLKEFFRINDKSDQFRNENFTDVFPEYIDLRSYVTP